MKPWRADRALYRADQVAELLSYDSVDTVYTLILIGELICHNRTPGRKGMRITGASIEAYVERHLIKPGDVEIATEAALERGKEKARGASKRTA